jgi:hypothetical protein
MSQTTLEEESVKKIIKPDAIENLNLLESLRPTISELISMYETVKPLIHFNVKYDLRYFDGKRDELRSTDFLLWRKLASLVLPTGGWFGVLLFKRRIRRIFKALLSTCDLCLLVERKNSCILQGDIIKEINTNVTKEITEIMTDVIEKEGLLTKRKPRHRTEHINMALQIAGAIIAIASIGWLQQFGPQVGGSFKLSYPILDLCTKNICILLYIPIVAIISTWIGPKLLWYRKVVNFCGLKDKEKHVYESLQKVLRLLVAENPEAKNLIV